MYICHILLSNIILLTNIYLQQLWSFVFFSWWKLFFKCNVQHVGLYYSHERLRDLKQRLFRNTERIWFNKPRDNSGHILHAADLKKIVRGPWPSTLFYVLYEYVNLENCERSVTGTNSCTAGVRGLVWLVCSCTDARRTLDCTPYVALYSGPMMSPQW